MSLLFATAAVTAATMVPACSWNAPGRHPYRGTAMEAVSRYVDIPAPTRARLVAKMAAGRADDDVVIRRDAIEGRGSYEPTITDMHFGRQTVCERVTRERWPAAAREPAKVYCADGHCLIVPRICGNVSRIRTVTAGGGTGGAAGAPGHPLRPGSIPVPAGAPEADIDTADALAQLAAGRPAPPPPALPDRPFGDWTPGPYGVPAPAPRATLTPPVALSPVPEPAGWAMFLVGAISVLVFSRFRR
jgi:hypothetical protein